MSLVLLVGLLLLVFSLMGTAMRESEDDEQQVYIIRGLAISFFVVGVFSFTTWLASVSLVNMFDFGFASIGCIISGIQLLLLISLGQERRV